MELPARRLRREGYARAAPLGLGNLMMDANGYTHAAPLALRSTSTPASFAALTGWLETDLLGEQRDEP